MEEPEERTVPPFLLGVPLTDREWSREESLASSLRAFPAFLLQHAMGADP